ncbi:unnamed protein product [Musa acuminata subsp. burmannicoides]
MKIAMTVAVRMDCVGPLSLIPQNSTSQVILRRLHDRSRSRGTHGMASPRSCCCSMEGIRRRRRRKSCCWRRRRRHETSSFRRKRRDGESRSRTTCSALFIDAAKGWWEEKTCMLCLLCDRIFVRFLR